MKKSLLLFLLTLSVKLFSQQYRTVTPSSDAWFNNSSDQVNAIHIDSIGISGTDTLYWNYPILREVPSLWVLDTIAPSWVGRYSILRQNGDEVYFNDVLDSIIFRTYLPVNSTWKLYDFPNGDYIRAKITTLSFQNVGPIADSVKTISLQQYNSSDQPITGYFNGLSFGVSRTNGFTQLFDFYNFPNDYTAWTRTDAHRLTYGEVFDFNIGDEFHSEEDYSGLSGPSPKFVRTVIGKNTWAADSIQYVFYRENTWTVIQNYTSTTYHSAAPETLMVYQLDSMIFNEYPKEPFHNFPMISSYDMDFHHLGSCRPLEIQYINGLYIYNTDSLFYPMPFEATTTSREWINGNGEYDGSGSLIYMYYFQYYLSFSKKGIDSCGFPLNVGIQDQNSNQNSISIYPVPSSSEIHLNYFSNADQKISLSIKNIEGKELFQIQNISMNLGKNDFPIELSALANGMYFLEIRDNSGLHAIKFLKD